MFRRRIWVLALLLSVLAHAGLVAFLMLGDVGEDVRDADGTSPRTGGSGQAEEREASNGDPVEVRPHEIVTLVGREQKRVDELSREEQEEDLSSKIERLGAIATQEVDRVATMVEGVLGVADRTLASPNPDAKGTFDSDSATIHDIRRVETDDGPIYRWTFVDAEGRTIESLRRESEMMSEDLLLCRTFDMARSNPGLRRVLDVVLKVAEDDESK
ncbi:MAG: hypothetical protein CMJ18_16875 [Phycisphaeraceae bacterium]|nr:hypothetical protein [Phycisphaeraceae bacterium]